MPGQTDAALPRLAGVARAGSLAFVGTSGAAVLGFVLTLVVTRGLSTDRAGVFFTATAIFLVVTTVLTFGAGAGIVRFVPRFVALDRAADIPALLVVAIVPITAVALLGTTVGYALAPVLARHAVHTENVAAAASTFRLLALFLVAGTLETVAVETSRAFGRIGAYVGVHQLLVPLARPALVGLVVLAHGPSWEIGVVWAIPLLVAVALAASVVRAELRDRFGTPAPWPARTTSLRAIAREYWGFTGARGVASIMDILLTWLDVVIVAAIVSASQAGIYAAASRFVTTGTLVMSALRLAIAPELSAALARRDTAHASAMYSVATQWVVLTSWPLYIVMGAFGPTILGLFGPRYPQGATALAVLCFSMLVMLAFGNVGTVLLMGGKSTWVLCDKIAMVTLNVVANLVLIPRYGITGAAVAWAITIVVDSSLAFVQVRWGMGIRATGIGIPVAALLALGCFGTGCIALRLLVGSSLLTLGVSVGAVTPLYVALAWRRRHALELPLLVRSLRPRAGVVSA